MYFPINDAPALNPANALTLETWVYVAALPPSADAVILVGKQDAATLQYQLALGNGPGYWSFRSLVVLQGGIWAYCYGNTVVQPQTWYHLALTYDGAALQQYVNGALDGSVAASGPVPTTTRPLVMGGWSAHWWNLNGEVDEPSLYNRALSQSEIQSIYNAGPAGKTLGGGPPPSACWTAWVDDSLPAGASPAVNNDAWTWITSNPSPFHGTAGHQSVTGAGFHQHYFYNASQTLTVNAGDTLFCYVYLDPVNPPSEVICGAVGAWSSGQ